jgi:hypothetical protein
MPSTATSILDGLSTSVAVKAPCRTVAISNITLAGLQTISGYTTVEDDRVLVKGQTDPVENGIYMASTGQWRRSKDADGNRDLVQGTRVIVRSSTVDGAEYELTTANPIVIGTTALTFELRYGANATWDQTEDEIAAGVTPINTGIEPGYVYRYGSNAVPGTTNMTSAIQAALDANDVVYLPNDDMAFTNVTIPANRTVIGQGPRNSRLIQTAGTTGYAIEFEDLSSSDISEGATWFKGFAVHVATTSHGIHMDGVNASMFLTDNFRLYSRHAESLGSPPYSTTANQRGIYIQNGSAGSIFFAHHRNLEIRSFDIAIDADDIINEWCIHGWILDCRIAVRLTDCSTWDLSGLTVETGVENARALQTFGAVSNIKWIGGRWELTQAGCYGLEGDGSTTGGNWRLAAINVLITGDGSAIPGQKWTGTLPNDVVFEGTDTVGPFMVIPNANQTHRMPQRIAIGGSGLGNGRITIGRDSGAADGTFEHDGTHHVITAGNSLKLRGDGTSNDRLEVNGTRVIVTGADGATGYTAALRFGTNSYLWVDSTGDLRIKQGTPTSDTDGSVVGTQS